MPKNKVSEWSSTASNNTDIGGINIAEGCAPSGINNAIRELMAQVKDMQTGADADNLVVGGALTCSGAAVFSSTVNAPTPSNGDNSTKVATTAFVQYALSTLYPVGSIYINSSNSTNPATLLGFGTWTAFGAGRVLVGINAADPLFDTAEETGGSKDAIVVSHNHGVTDPGHVHSVTYMGLLPRDEDAGSGQVGADNAPAFNTESATTGITIDTEGSSGTNANIQPYIVVYMWKRTA